MIDSLKNKHVFVNGGWWQDLQILGAMGDGIEREELRGWNGWWNEETVWLNEQHKWINANFYKLSLVRQSVQRNDTLTVLITGRLKYPFAQLVSRIVASQELDFDMVCLKPKEFQGTLEFKKAFLEELLQTYTEAEEIRVYDDRHKHVKEFREFFIAFNKRRMPDTIPPPFHKPLTVEVFQVTDIEAFLDPGIEITQVQRMINEQDAQSIQISAALNSQVGQS